MADADGTRPILIRKTIKRAAEGHHGGAWKVAYADFVTAMMAFFLLMWLLNATTENQRKGLADYFDPSVPISPISAGGSSVLEGDSFLVEGERVSDSEDGVRPDTAMPRRDGLGEEAAEGTAPDPVEDGNGEMRGAGAPDEAVLEAEFEAVAERIRAAMAGAGGGLDEHFILHVSPEGLVIEIVDASDAPLFASGSAAPSARLGRLIGVIAPVLNRTLNAVKLVGHTDSRPFDGRGSDNWRLSAERANTARRLLDGAGMAPARIAEVAGRAATEPLMPDPAAPQNRRIAVTLLREAGR